MSRSRVAPPPLKTNEHVSYSRVSAEGPCLAEQPHTLGSQYCVDSLGVQCDDTEKPTSLSPVW